MMPPRTIHKVSYLEKPIYLASPYSSSHLDKKVAEMVRNYRYETVTEIAAKLTEMYKYAFILPITQSHNLAKYMNNPDGGFAAWERIDKIFIEACAEIWVVTMKGWKESIGVTEEIKFAKEHKLIIRYVNPDTLEVTNE